MAADLKNISEQIASKDPQVLLEYRSSCDFLRLTGEVSTINLDHLAFIDIVGKNKDQTFLCVISNLSFHQESLS